MNEPKILERIKGYFERNPDKRPIHCSFESSVGCCGLTAANNGEMPAGEEGKYLPGFAKVLEVKQEYVDGFVGGWDCSDADVRTVTDTHQAGFLDGQEAWKEMQKERSS